MFAGVNCVAESLELSNHPVCAFKGGFAASFLIAQPPLLGKEGNVRRIMHFVRHSYNGNRMVNAEPLPIRLVTLMVPPWLSIACFTMDKPRPVPPDSRVLALSTR